MPPKKEKRLLYQPKDMVLAKMTGFPAWPSFVMPPETIPPSIMKAKKKTTNTCVIFIPDGDFNWMNEKSLEALSPEKLQAKLDKLPKDKMKPKPKKKSTRTTNVIEAFVAANGLQFDDFMADLKDGKESFDDEDFDDEDNEEEEEMVEEDASTINNPDPDNEESRDNQKEQKLGEPAEQQVPEVPAPPTKTRPTKKEPVRGKRRSPRSTSEDDADTESVEQDSSSSRKGLGSDDHITTDGENEDDKIADTKDDNGDVINGSQQEDEEPAQKPVSTRKRTRGARGDVSTQESDDIIDGKAKEENDADNEESAPKKQAPEVRAGSPKLMGDKDRQHQLWLCRIKLQRTLIQRNQPVTPKDPSIFPPPTVDELSMARIILQKLADFPVTVELLRDTKIHKVLKCIVRDNDLEYPDSFRLHEKCKELLEKWQSLIEDLKLVKLGRPESRIGSTAPEDSEISGVEIKPTLDKDSAGKVGV